MAELALGSDPEIEALKLEPKVREAAYKLKAAHPTTRFTSGRRNRKEQASAMAANVMKQQDWIEVTYKDTPVRKALQKWVDDYFAATPKAKRTREEIAAGLLATFNSFPNEKVGAFSKHLAGLAFDVQPVGGTAGKAVKQTIAKLPGLKLFLEKEGKLTIWHAEF